MLETVSDISGSPTSHLLGLCGGGVLAFLTAAYLAAIEQQHILATLTIAIAILDYHHGPSAMAYLDLQGRSTVLYVAQSSTATSMPRVGVVVRADPAH